MIESLSLNLLDKSKLLSRKQKELILIVALIMSLILIIFGRIKSVSMSRIWYFEFICFATLPYYLVKCKADRLTNFITYYLFLPSLFMILIISVATNQGVSIIAHGTIFGLYALILLADKKDFLGLKTVTVFMLIVYFFGWFLFIPDHMGGSDTLITKSRNCISLGSAKNIFLHNDMYNKTIVLNEITSKFVNERDKLFIISDRVKSVVYSGIKAQEAEPGPYYISYNSDKYSKFYELNPNRIPNIIVIDKSIFISFDEWWNTSDLAKTLNSYNFKPNNCIEYKNYLIIRAEG